ncbi:MAG TPA: toluene-4-monooxygenase system B family protein [Polyangiaceae bacterium]
MLIPLYGFVRGDTLGLLVLVQGTDTVAELAANMTQAASPRIPPGSRAIVRRNGAVLDDALTVAEVGFTPLERVDLTLEPGA